MVHQHYQRLHVDKPSLEYTLVVVHMQPWIIAPHDVIVEPVKRTIQQAIKDNVGIVLLEWEGMDPTLTCLRELLDDYPHWLTVTKSSTDGSDVVIEACRNNGFWLNHMAVCGVALHVCVAATIRGLTQSLPLAKIELIKSATDRASDGYDWSTYPNQDKTPSPENLILSEKLNG